jgi:DNA-binding NtrC family response regulator
MNATILVLGSAPVVRSVISETLTRAGYTVLATGDVGKAVDILHQCTPDLLIIHPYVADLPGIEAAKYLHGKCPSMRVLMVAGLLDDDRLENPLALQGFKFFPKPFTAAQLLAEVKEVLSATGPQYTEIYPPKF